MPQHGAESAARDREAGDVVTTSQRAAVAEAVRAAVAFDLAERALEEARDAWLEADGRLYDAWERLPRILEDEANDWLREGRVA